MFNSKDNLWTNCKHNKVLDKVCQDCGTIVEKEEVRKYNQTAFRDRYDRIRCYKFESGKIFCSNGETLEYSANYYRAKTERGRKNLKVTKLTKNNWKAAARIHADSAGYFKSVDVTISEFLDFDNLSQPLEIDEAPLGIVEKWLKKERL